jgi:hypothetical protein
MQGLVKTEKESQQVRGTYQLSSAERGKNQDSERKPARRDAALTICRIQRDGLIRTAKEGRLARVTHLLSSAEGGTRQEREKSQASEGYSPAVERSGRDTSGHRTRGGGRYEYRIRSQDVGNM